MKLKITRKDVTYQLLILNMFLFILPVSYGMDLYEDYQSLFVKKQVTKIAKAEVKEPTMREWVKAEIEKAGLNWKEAECLIQNESGWDNWKYGINKNGSTDMGLWQWNSIHKDNVSVECRWDYKCATKKAIEKRLHDGNWSAWYGWVYNCQN